MADTANIYATDATRTLTHHDIEPVSAPEADLEAAVARHYSSSLDPRIQLDVPDFCDRACAAVEGWLVTIEDGAMLARLAGMMKIDRA